MMLLVRACVRVPTPLARSFAVSSVPTYLGVTCVAIRSLLLHLYLYHPHTFLFSSPATTPLLSELKGMFVFILG
jgi:hypothetical protein